MIAKTAIIKTVLERVKSLPVGHYFDMRTYKRNRSVIIVKQDEDRFLLVEDGFYQDQFVIDFSKMKKTLKNLLKKEFPRSTKIRLYTMGCYDPAKVKENMRKVI